jgi:hypothetical protein
MAQKVFPLAAAAPGLRNRIADSIGFFFKKA